MIKITPDTQWKWLHLPVNDRVANLNDKLIKVQQVDEVNLSKIHKAHADKLALFEEARLFLTRLAKKGFMVDDDRRTCLAFNKRLQNLEYTAQDHWGFEKDILHHNWWLDMPGCECPRMDNQECIGVDRMILSASCPWHGHFNIKTEI